MSESPIEQPVPPSRSILDLDEALLRQALVEAMQLLKHAPQLLESPGPLRQWRCQVWVRLSYLLINCSNKCSGNSRSDLLHLGLHHNSLAQSLLRQDEALSRLRNRNS